MKEISGNFRIRALLTYSIDKERSAKFGTPIRSMEPERILTPEELRKAIENRSHPIHEFGFAILFAFDGKVNGRPLSFDTQKKAEYKTLGYAHASVVDGDKIFCHISLNEIPDYQRQSCLYGGFGYKSPDLLAGIKLEDIAEDAELKIRRWKDKDFDKFPHKMMRTVNYEPGHFAKAAQYILPAQTKIRRNNSMAKKRGRKADPDKEHFMPLPNKDVLDILQRWNERKAEHLNGFTAEVIKERSIVFTRTREDSVSKIRVAASTRRIEIMYWGNVDGKMDWKLYKQWVHAIEIDEEAVRKEILQAAKKLFGAFK